MSRRWIKPKKKKKKKSRAKNFLKNVFLDCYNE